MDANTRSCYASTAPRNASAFSASASTCNGDSRWPAHSAAAAATHQLQVANRRACGIHVIVVIADARCRCSSAQRCGPGRDGHAPDAAQRAAHSCGGKPGARTKASMGQDQPRHKGGARSGVPKRRRPAAPRAPASVARAGSPARGRQRRPSFSAAPSCCDAARASTTPRRVPAARERGSSVQVLAGEVEGRAQHRARQVFRFPPACLASARSPRPAQGARPAVVSSNASAAAGEPSSLQASGCQGSTQNGGEVGQRTLASAAAVTPAAAQREQRVEVARARPRMESGVQCRARRKQRPRRAAPPRLHRPPPLPRRAGCPRRPVGHAPRLSRVACGVACRRLRAASAQQQNAHNARAPPPPAASRVAPCAGMACRSGRELPTPLNARRSARESRR